MEHYMDITRKGIAAGVFISLATIVSSNIENPISAAFCFSLGLLAIMMCGLWLFTGKAGSLFDTVDPMELITTLAANFVGCAFVAIFAILSKYPMPTLVAVQGGWFFRAVCCGLFIDLACRCRNPLITILSVMSFILMKGAHCIVVYFSIIVSQGTFKAPLLVIIIGNLIGCNLLRLVKIHSQH